MKRIAAFAVLFAFAVAFIGRSPASVVTQSGPRLFTSSSSSGGGFTFNTAGGWSGSGTFADGQIVTLTKSGGGLSIPTDPRPTFWAPLESGTVKDSTYSRSTTAFTLQTNAAIQSTVKPTNAAGALDQRFQGGAGTQPGNSSNPDSNFFQDAPLATVSGKAFVSVKRYRDFAADSCCSGGINGKNFRIWEAAYPSGTTDIYIKDGFGNAAIVEGTSIDGYAQHGGLTPSFSWPFPVSTWWTEEFIFKEGTSGNTDGYIDSSRNGGWAFGATNRAWMTMPSDAARAKTKLFLSQYSSTPTAAPADNSHEYLAQLYVNGDSVFRVVISTESTYRTTISGSAGAQDLGVNREVQLPVQNSGSTTGVQILIRKGAYSSLSGLYMYLIDDTETAFFVGQFTSIFDVVTPIFRALDRSRSAANDPDYSYQVAA